MHEILLTINGNRELPITADKDLIDMLTDVNTEIALRVTVSPYEVAVLLNQEGGQNITQYKTKIVNVEVI